MSQDADHELAKLWVEAIERYTSVTGIDLRTDPNVIRVASGHDLMSKIETQQTQFTKFCERKETLWKVLGEIATGVEIIASIASDGISQVFPPSSVIFAAVSYLIKGAKNVGSAYESIIQLLESMKVFITSISLHAQHSIRVELRQIFVKKLSCFLLILGMSTKLIKDGRALRFVKNILQGGDSSGLQAHVNELEILSKHEKALVDSITLNAVFNQSATLAAVGKDVAGIAKHVETISLQNMNADRDNQLRTLKDRLNPELSVETDYDNIKTNLLLGTGDWIISNPTFQAWLDGSASSLWLSGHAGEGKTYLSARVIRELMEKYPQDENTETTTRTNVSYFLCKATNERTRLFSVISRTLAYQIARKDPAYRNYLLKTFRPDSEAHAGPSRAWEILFTNFFANEDVQSHLYVVIDGLDEISRDEFEGVQNFLKSLRVLLDRIRIHNNRSRHLKILLVGRPEMDDMIGVSNIGPFTSTIRLSDMSSHNLDVVNYIDDQLSRIGNFAEVSPTRQVAIKQKLAERTFLWVKLVCKEIAFADTEGEMCAMLDDFPDDLRTIIRHILERFSRYNARKIADLNELLQWVICAQDPMTLGRLEEVMTIHSGGPVFGLERLLRTRYSTFFTLARKDGLGTTDLQNKSRGTLGNDTSNNAELNDIVFDSPKDTTTVHISHLVFLEYFRSEIKTTAVGVDITKAKVHLLLRCLSLLCDGEKVDRWNCAKMLSYAGYFWMDYLSKIDITSVSADDKRTVSIYLHRLFTVETALDRWCDGIYYLRLCEKLFDTDATTKAIVQWVNDEAIGPGQIGDWSERVKADVKALFAPLIQFCTAKLFRDYSDEPLRWFYLIYGYLYRFESDLLKGRMRASAWNVTSANVLAVIDWADPPEDSRVFARIGDLLRKVGDFGHAEEWYLKAAALSDPPGPGFRVTSGLARTYGHKPKPDYRKAVEWGNRALENYEDEFTKDADALAWGIAEWTGWLYDANEVTLAEALAQWDSAFEHNSRNPGFAVAYLNQLENWEQHTQAILMMKSFADVDWDPNGLGVTHSFLVEIVHLHADDDDYYQPLLQRAARETNNIPWLIELYRTALAAAADLPDPERRGEREALLQVQLYLLLLDDSQYKDYAIELSEELLSGVMLSAQRGAYNNPDKVNRSLCEIYCQRALRAEKDGNDLDPYLAKLKQTVDRMETDADVFREEEAVEPIKRLSVYRVHAPDLLLGTWYRLHGQENEAGPTFWRRISLAIDVLHGDIEENYDRAYEFLAFALMAAGDLRGCRAALHLIGGLVLPETCRTWPAETEESGIDKFYDTPPTRWICDGPCNRDLFIPHGMHVCLDGCLSTTFCSPCLGKLKRRELDYKICSPDHHWLHTTREGMPDLEEGKVLFVADGDQPEVVMDREEWFDQLREKWGIRTH